MLNCVFCDQNSPVGSPTCQLCNAPLPDSETSPLPDSVFRQHLLQLLKTDQREQANAAYRRRMGVDSAAADEVLDALDRDQQFNVMPEYADVEWAVVGYLERGQKIAAIKFFRDKTQLGLKEAKDAVEAIEQRLGLGAAPQSTGCFGMVLLLWMVLGSVGVLLLSAG